MSSSGDSERPKLTDSIKPTSTTPVGQTTTNSTTKSGNSSSEDPPILRLPPELLSAIINYLPMSQWSGLEFVNRSFRNAVYLSWYSVKEIDVDKDVLTVRQSFNGADLSNFLPSIIAKLLLRSPLLSSIIGLQSNMTQSQTEILPTISQFTHLKRIDFGSFFLESTELVEFLTSSASRDQLKEISASAYYPRTNNWPDILADQEHHDLQASRLQLEKFSLNNGYLEVLDPRIIDLINLSTLTQLILVNITAPSDYLLSLISNCQQLQQLQFIFMTRCCCQQDNCVHLISSKRLLETISAFENLSSLKIDIVDKYRDYHYDDAGGIPQHYHLDILDDLLILIDCLGQRGRLVEFGLCYEYYCIDQVVTGIGDNLPNLKSLELFTQECRPAILVNMIKKLVNLEKLAFHNSQLMTWNRGITSEVLTSVATYLQRLKSFHIRVGNYNHDVAESLHVLTRLERLEKLSIIGGLFTKVKWEMEASFGQLRSLELQECHKDLVVSFLNRAPGLHRLVIGGSSCLPHTVLRMIPRACQRLRQLDFSVGMHDKNNMKEVIRDIIDRSLDLIQLKCWK